MADGELSVEFSGFYRQYYGLILVTAEKRVNGFAVAEDVASEVFRIAWQHHAAGGKPGLPWLYRVVRNVIGTEYRRAARAKRLDDRLREHESTLGAETDHDEVFDVLLGMNDLRSNDREILRLVYWDDLTGKEVAAVLGISSAAARVRLLRARAALKDLLAGDGCDGT